jgi:diguanylate cyclase (GGDEF)-like protein
MNKKNNKLEKITKAIEDEIEAFGTVMDVSKFKELQSQLEKYLIRDALTLALNRWKFEEVLEREIKRAKDNGTNLCLLMVDLDNLKKTNDTLGHEEGDRVLKEIVWQMEWTIEKTIGKSHRLGRWGGDEFLYIFPLKNIVDVKKIAEKAKSHINNLYNKDLVCFPASVSIGVSHLKKSDDTKSFIKRVDKAMYRAKKKGGNKVEVAK